MKKIYLHIGPHKTGTTFLQKAFQENINVLKDNGIDYIDFGKQYFGHHEIALGIQQGRYGSGVIRQEIQKSTCDTILISSENFDVLNYQQIEFLANELEIYDVEVLVSYRTPTVRLYSWWQEEIKHGATKTYFEYVFSHYSKPYSSKILNIGCFVDDYRDLFGIDKIKFFDYEWCVSNGGLLECFNKHLGLTGKLEVEDERVNDGLSVSDVEIIRSLNLLAKRKGELSGFNVRDAYLKRWGSNNKNNSELIRIQSERFLKVEVGGSFVDRMLKEFLLNDYSGCFVTGISDSYKNKNMMIPDSSWMHDSRSEGLIENIYKTIMV